MSRRRRGEGTVRMLNESIEYGSVDLPPPDVQWEAAVALASVAAGPMDLAEILEIVGLYEPEQPEQMPRPQSIRRCRQGHAMTDDNTDIQPSGKRRCRTCYVDYVLRFNERRRRPCSQCGGQKKPGDRHLCRSCKGLREKNPPAHFLRADPMICSSCARQLHDQCTGCPCQHRTTEGGDSSDEPE